MQFLAHVERCKVLLHLVDGTSETVAEDYQTIVTELEAYAEALGDKARVVALNKCDALDADTIKKRKKALEKASGGPVMTISGVAGMGLQDTLRALHAHIKYQAPVVDDAPWQP
jgi:GTP-binding protein